MSSAVITFTPLHTELGLIHAYGVDAEKFLQGQFSNDLHALASGHGQWSSYSTAKGRMIANFYVQRDGDGFWLSLAADMADIVIERLRKFRMMAKLERQMCIRDSTTSRLRQRCGWPARPHLQHSIAGSRQQRRGRRRQDHYPPALGG